MKEFNSWATAAAAIFGYDVEIDGLGTAADEDTALSIKPALQDVGFATQACCLQRCCFVVVVAAHALCLWQQRSISISRVHSALLLRSI